METKKRIFSEEHRRKISEYRKGKKMSNQVKKDQREKVDRGNKYDIYDNQSSRFCNPKGHKTIHEGIINLYCQCPTEELKYLCVLDYFQKFFDSKESLPDCWKKCSKRLTIHPCGGDSKYPVVEFMTKWLRSDPNMIYISRPVAFFNFYHKLPIIFRPCWENGYHLHHFQFPLHDDPTELAIIKASTHAKITSSITPIQQKIITIQEFLKSDPKNILAKRTLMTHQNEIRKISKVDNDPDFWELVNKIYRQASNISEI